ncbi:hypothetical protein NDU88_000686 [Pleurodeles waltl]|uniref:Uncharacterized protein n=1 Tax=Pleurodeles waltl TaxID=8319 RepID=A0AAV7S5C6_PLEWA|nr:hypothetical protein NDU88_000686 [Pleurodeles waltl]
MKEDNIWQNRRGQHQVKARMDRDLPAVLDLEQRIQVRCSALQQAAALSSAGHCSNPDVLDSHASNGEFYYHMALCAKFACSSGYNPTDIRHYFCIHASIHMYVALDNV